MVNIRSNNCLFVQGKPLHYSANCTSEFLRPVTLCQLFVVKLKINCVFLMFLQPPAAVQELSLETKVR